MIKIILTILSPVFLMACIAVMGFNFGNASGFERGSYVMSTMILRGWEADREARKPRLSDADRRYDI